jgi:hypothetical protein
MNNKHERVKAGHKKAFKRAKSFGWKESKFEDLPKETRVAILGCKDLRLPSNDPNKMKKSFGKSTKKDHYGHFSGSCQTHGSRKQIIRRIEDRELL